VLERPWQAAAACLGAGPVGFLEPLSVKRDRWRVDVCSACPVRRECALQALAHLERGEPLVGLWAGVAFVGHRRRRDLVRELREVIG
jgi:hypothetical protein